MISEYDKVHNEHNLRVNLIRSSNELGLEDDTYLKLSSDYGDNRTTYFVIYNENPVPARVCIEDFSKRFFTCIGLFEPIYYIHDIYQNTFTKEQKVLLNNIMNGKRFPIGNSNITVWSGLANSWKIIMEENNMVVSEYNIIQPDYTLLPDIHREY